MAKTTPATFIREVKQESKRVTWATKKETLATTATVLVMVVIAAIFFLIVDWIFSSAIQGLINL